VRNVWAREARTSRSASCTVNSSGTLTGFDGVNGLIVMRVSMNVLTALGLSFDTMSPVVRVMVCPSTSNEKLAVTVV